MNGYNRSTNRFYSSRCDRRSLLVCSILIILAILLLFYRVIISPYVTTTSSTLSINKPSLNSKEDFETIHKNNDKISEWENSIFYCHATRYHEVIEVERFRFESSKPLILPVPKLIYTNPSGFEAILMISEYFNISWFSSNSKNHISSKIQRFCHRSRLLSILPSEDIKTVHVNRINIHLHSNSVADYLYRGQLLTASQFLNQSEEIGSIHREEYLIDISPPFLEPGPSSEPRYGGASLFVNISIYINTIYGLQASLASLTQLLAKPVVTTLPLIIHDWPSHQWRGLMIDVARHFQPLPYLKRCLDAMEVSKLNVLHIHLTDSQSFPVLFDDDLIQNLPLSHLALNGSFSHDKIYRKSDLQDIVTYAMDRGIEIIPEIDIPAHTLAWKKAFPEMIVNCSNLANHEQTPHNIYILNPVVPVTKQVLEGIFRQMAEIFPSKYVHVGGDEVNLACWEESLEIRKYIHETNKSYSSLFFEFESHVFDIVRKYHKVPIVWQGLMDANIIQQDLSTPNANDIFYNDDSRIVVQPWKCWGGLAVRAAVASYDANHPVVMSACWYLDYDSDWTTFLATDLIASAVTAINKPHRRLVDRLRNVKSGPIYRNLTSNQDITTITMTTKSCLLHENYFYGGEGNMWTEQVDYTNLECRMWPRAIAIATRLWGYETNQPVIMNYTSIDSRFLTDEYLSTPETQSTILSHQFRYQKASLIRQNDDISLSNRRKLSSTVYLLSVNESRYLLSSFVRYRYFLKESIKISAAPLVFHKYISISHKFNKPMRQGMTLAETSNRFEMRPIFIQNESQAQRDIQKIERGIELSTNGFHTKNSHTDSIGITARCLGIPEKIQRPLPSSSLKIAQLNINEGSNGQRDEDMLAWLQSKANEGYLFIGLCELNGWEEISSTFDITKNLPKIAFKAANAGFSYYHIMVNSQPYHLGLISAIPFQIKGEYGPPLFQRGVLHVYFEEIQLHAFIVHLHAHSSQARQDEASRIIELAEPWLLQNRNVVIMGDLNTLSSWDQRQHNVSELVSFFNRDEHAVFARLRKKFLKENSLPREINYEPMDLFLRTGFRDSCIHSCQFKSKATIASDACDLATSIVDFKRSNGMISSWSLVENNELSMCMKKFCPYTEPTKFNPEWSDIEAMVPHPKIRLDYILLSPSLVGAFNLLSPLCNGSVSDKKIVTNLQSSVEINNITDMISDHYPVLLSWTEL